MRNSIYFVHGVFNYTPIAVELWSTRLEVEDMSDNHLVDEIYFLYVPYIPVDIIIDEFYWNIEKTLNEEERNTLIMFYVSVNADCGIYYDDLGEL